MSRPPSRYIFRGQRLTVAEIAALTGRDKANVHRCIEGESIREASEQSAPHYVTHDGKTLALSEWSRLTGIPRPTIIYRLSRGWPVAKVLSTQPMKCGRWKQRARSQS